MVRFVRLTSQEQEALSVYANRVGMSQNDVMRTALRDFIRRRAHDELLEEVLDGETERFAEALRRLGE